MKILITGSAGFIGFSLAKKLLENKNNNIIGIDNLNNYYDKKIKLKRLKILKKNRNFKFFYGDLKNNNFLKKKKFKKINYIFHLAGQAGVRYSIKNPSSYINDNILAYINLLENFKSSKKLRSIFYASSSSVYGDYSFSKSNEHLKKPISVYAVSKLTMELLSNTYLNLYGLKCIGLRFFTVYGPWGRPDMAYFKFCKLLSKKKKIEIYNQGNHSRSFTYIDDVIDNIFLVIKNLKKINLKKQSVFNIGNPNSEPLNKFIALLEKNLSFKAKKLFKKKQLGDVLMTKANNEVEKKLFNFKYKISLQEGIKKFVKWYKTEYEKK